jgi:hypothetical protein
MPSYRSKLVCKLTEDALLCLLDLLCQNPKVLRIRQEDVRGSGVASPGPISVSTCYLAKLEAHLERVIVDVHVTLVLIPELDGEPSRWSSGLCDCMDAPDIGTAC